jgi:hypothetical protein
MIMNTTTASSEMKWKPYRFVIWPSDISGVNVTSLAWNFLASSSTMNSSDM